MRNFGNDSFSSQHYPQLPPTQNHYQFAPLSMHHHPNVSSSIGTQNPVKQESYPLAKSIGVGANLKQSSKHFSPANIVVAPSSLLHHSNNSGHHNNSSNYNYSSNSSNGIPINLSHGHVTTTATTTMISSSSETNSPAAVIVSHLPTAALTAACPSGSRGPSPSSHQQNPINGLPYHSTHSPTLPIAHTALPTEVQISSNRSSPMSLAPQISRNMPNPPYQHLHYHVPNNKGSPLAGTVADLSQNTPNRCSPNLTPSNHVLTAIAVSEATRSHPSSTTSEDNSNVITNRSNNNITGTNTANQTTRMVGQNVNGTLTVTGIPKSDSELQLFRVLQRANLLSYFDLMIELGGDDVQQLCEAGKEEFLEIMGLIGMAAKPLHVRRLQKTLLEWKTQPNLFQLQHFQSTIPAGYQHSFGVLNVDPTASQSQYTTTVATVASNVSTGEISHHQISNHHHPHPVIPVPHLVSHNPISPYTAHNAPMYALEPPNNSPPPSNESSKLELSAHNNNFTKNVKSHERSSNSSSPSLSSNAAAPIVGLDKVYLQRGSSSIPVVISTAQSYNFGQPGLSSSSPSFAEHYQNCPSPSGSTSSSSSRSSTVSIRSHHQFHQATSPLENSPDSPVNSESGRSNKHEESNSSTCIELENASSSSSPHDQTNSIQLLDNSTGTGILRVASRSSSYCGSVGGSGGSEPNSPAPPPPPSFSKGILVSSSSSQQTSRDSPRPSPESITNRNNNSVGATATTSSQDFSSLQEHEIQKLAETAENLVQSLPPHVKEPKFSKKIEMASYEYILRLAEDDPRRMDEIRRLSAIFGKIGENGKRSSKGNYTGITNSLSNRSMSILELAMNEAAAQLCKLLPALLTKRDDMFKLARQVIQESGLPYTVICASSNLSNTFLSNIANNNNNDGTATSGSPKVKIDDTRNSPAHEERITFEFAAACKKIKLDMQNNEDNESTSSNRKSSNRKKGPPKEDKIVTATALKRMAMATSEYRKNCKSAQTTTVSCTTVRT